MAYLINPEDQDLLDSVREFCEKEIKEQCKEYDVSGEWPEEIYAKAAELGYNGLEVPGQGSRAALIHTVQFRGAARPLAAFTAHR